METETSHSVLSTQKLEGLKKQGYARLKALVDNGWKIDWLVGPPRSGTNTMVNILAETPAIDGAHMRDAFYYHQGLNIPADAHFNIVCGLLADEIERIIKTRGPGQKHFLVKDMPQPFANEDLWNKWLNMVHNFIVVYKDPHETTQSLVTALANDEHIRSTQFKHEAGDVALSPEAMDKAAEKRPVTLKKAMFGQPEGAELPALFGNGSLFKKDADAYATGLRDSTLDGLLEKDGRYTDLRYGHWNNMQHILSRITEHVEKSQEKGEKKSLSVVDFNMMRGQPKLLEKLVERAGLGKGDHLLDGWTKAVGRSNFRRVSSSQFSVEKFPPKSDPRKDLVWERHSLVPPFSLWGLEKPLPSMDIFPEKMQTILQKNLLPYYLDVLRHDALIGPETAGEMRDFMAQSQGSRCVEDVLPVTCYAYATARLKEAEKAPLLEELRQLWPQHAKAFKAIDTAAAKLPPIATKATGVEVVHEPADRHPELV